MIGEFKEGDCVLLKNGPSRKMTISHLFEELKTASCVWYDEKHDVNVSEDLPISVLKHCPRELTEAERVKIMQEIIPPRNH